MIKTHCINFSKKKVKEISTFLSLAFPSPNLLFPNICPNFMSSFSEFSFLGVFCFLFLYRQVCMSMHHACANGKEGTGFFGNGIMNRCTQVLGQAISALIPEPCPQSLPKSSSSSYILKKTVIVILVCHRRLLH